MRVGTEVAQFVPCQSCRRVVNRYLEVCPYCGEDPGGDRSDAPAPDAGLKPPPRYYLLDGVGLFTRLLLGLVIAASIIRVFTAIEYRSDLMDLASGVGASGLALSEDRFNVAALLGSVAYVVTSVAFVTWFWRAYANLSFFGRKRKRSPGWAIGSWFIPFAGMVIPYGIGAEIWTQSKPEPGPITARRDDNMEPVISWWALYLIMSVVNIVESFMLQEDYTTDDLVAFVGVDIVASVVAIAAAIAAIRFVLLATRRQERLNNLTVAV